MTAIGTSPPTGNLHEWDASFFDGVSPSRQPVKVSVMSDGLQIGKIVEEGVLWRYENIRQPKAFIQGNRSVLKLADHNLKF